MIKLTHGSGMQMAPVNSHPSFLVIIFKSPDETLYMSTNVLQYWGVTEGRMTLPVQVAVADTPVVIAPLVVGVGVGLVASPTNKVCFDVV
jgi:hypothetical protein